MYLLRFAHFFTLLIKPEAAIRIETLRNAGFSYTQCANQLNIKKGTIAKHCQKIVLLNSLPPVLR
jgi:DNA invertase Pin-like site-specific DNA recombinase